jgi:hypothetical protein
MRQVLGLDAKSKVVYSRTCQVVVLIFQYNGISTIIAENTHHIGQFSIVRCIAETLKSHQLIKLKPSHSVAGQFVIDWILGERSDRYFSSNPKLPKGRCNQKQCQTVRKEANQLFESKAAAA